MQFFTPVNIPKLELQIDYNADVLLIGSCFAENIARKLSFYQFRHTLNPWGILFHPLAIEKLLVTALEKESLNDEHIFCHQDIWRSFDTHSSLNALSKENMMTLLHQQTDLMGDKIRQATHIVITLGTAWAYRNKISQKYVANCHKIPQSEFSKELLSVEEIYRSLKNIVDGIKSVNPDCQLIFTISPVRHIKDGIVENQRSKAHLIASLHEFLYNEKSGKCYYFPAYEIMMDELRDYRFYAEDKLHPNQTAIDFIWEKFTESCIDVKVLDDMKKVEEIQKSLQHKPFNPNAENHQKFLLNLQQKIKHLEQKFPFMNFVDKTE